MKKFHFLFLSLFVMTCLYAGEPAGKFHSLGENINVSAISFNGKYVLSFTQNNGSKIWTTEDGLVAIDNSIDGSRSYAVSDNKIIVGKYSDPNYTYTEGGEDIRVSSGGYFKDGQWHSLGIREGVAVTPTSGSSADAISADGTIIGGLSYDKNMKADAAVWRNGKLEILPKEGADYARVLAMSADGKVMGGWIQPESERKPVLWIDGVLKKITYNDQQYGGEVLGISQNGKYAAIYLQLAGAKPAIYDIEKDKVILVNNPKNEIGFAHDVSDDGIAVGYFAGAMWSPDYAFIFSEKFGTYNLTEYMTSMGIEYPTDVAIARAEGISADGLRIAGNANKFGIVPCGWALDIDKHKEGYNPAKNLTIKEENSGNISLQWEAAEPETGQTLSGYNIYRNETLINTELVTELSYTDNITANNTYIYQVKAVWNETSEAEPTDAKINFGKLNMPFYDNFDTESFDTYLWDFEKRSTTSWKISVVGGINPPCLVFVAPKSTTYSEGILSPYINATESDEVYVSFNLARAHGVASNHKLQIEVFDGSQWNVAKEFTAVTSAELFKYYEVNISQWAAGKDMRIRFSAIGENDESYIAWNIDNVRVYNQTDEIQIDVPLNLTAVRKENGNVALSWTDPNQTANLTYISDKGYADFVGNVGRPVIFANLFHKEDLAAYDGYKLKSISTFFTTLTPNDKAAYSLYVSDGESRILNQPVEDYTLNSWNTIEIESDIVINPEKPLYIGIEVTYHNASDMPVGLSAIDEVNGKSNLYSEDGGKTWGTLIDFNIKRSVSLSTAIVKENGLTPRDGILGYAIHRDGVALLGDDIFNPLNQYTDLEAPDKSCCYQVSAFYYIQQKVSDKTAKICIEEYLSIDDEYVTDQSIKVLPNPADEYIRIEGSFTEATLMDMNGHSLQTTKESRINLESLPTGNYLLKVKTDKATVVKKIIKK